MTAPTLGLQGSPAVDKASYAPGETITLNVAAVFALQATSLTGHLTGQVSDGATPYNIAADIVVTGAVKKVPVILKTAQLTIPGVAAPVVFTISADGKTATAKVPQLPAP